ncbi:MerR family transcriptional regulator, partial [Paenibacillus tundrae]|uniref:MerR family transcriptional regulator n=1 Tax=Paenibacillus tundrae TaxID=528187 RepID=UPI0022A8DF48
MKNDYKINEISKLYGIGVDALRYYEKLGLLVPRRDGNGYRLYSLQDMYKLNIIRDLRQLDFTRGRQPMKNDYKINEISKLYGIGVDALRYYEKLGLLVPRRDGNGYRLYSLQDMYKLNIIRDLRQLDFT